MTQPTDRTEHVPGQLHLPHAITREELVAGNPERAELLERIERLDMAELAHRADALQEVEKATAEDAAAGKALDEAVAIARGLGATWEQIGAAAGMTRQSAWRRWGKVPDDFMVGEGVREDGL